MDTHEKDEKSNSCLHLENAVDTPVPEAETTAAVSAERDEHAMGMLQSFKEYRGAIGWSLIVSLCIIMEGYDLALISNVIALEGFKKRYGHFVNDSVGYSITAGWQSGVTQAPTIGAFIGVLIASPMATRLGYKWTLEISLVFMIAAIFVVFFSNSLPMLFAGQLLSGIPWGAFAVIPAAYATEVAPIHLRAVLTTYVQLCWCMGQLVASGVMYSVRNIETEWSYKIPFALQWVWPLPLLIILYWAPESPWWLVRKGEIEKATRTVSRLGRLPKRNPEEIVAMMIRTNAIEQAATANSSWIDCFKGSDLRRTMIMCAIHALANVTGLLISNLGTYFFTVAGIDTNTAWALGLANTGIQFLAVMCSVPILSRWSRRGVTMTGLIFNMVCLIIMGVLSCLKQTKPVQYGQGALVIILGMQWGLTLGPMLWTVVGETSSLRLRAISIGISRDVYYLSCVSIGILNSYMLNPTGFNLVGKTAFVYLGTAGGCLALTYFCLPELKGRSYREADILFHRRVPARKFASTVVGEYDDA